jgi:hypothetical protein
MYGIVIMKPEQSGEETFVSDADTLALMTETETLMNKVVEQLK